MKRREIAKFASGFAADQFLTHGVMAAAGTEFTLMGIAYTPRPEHRRRGRLGDTMPGAGPFFVDQTRPCA